MGETTERFPWFEAPFWEEVCARAEQVAREEGDAVARAHVYFMLLTHQLLPALVPTVMRARSGPDDWLSLQPGLETSAVAIEASAPLGSIGYGPEVERNREMVDRTLSLVRERSAGASPQAREAAETWRARLLARGPASACRRREGPRPIWEDRSKELGHEPISGERDVHLQRPHDRFFRSARAGVEDAALVALLDAWIADLEDNYDELVRLVPADCLDHAELAFEAVEADAERPSGPGVGDLPSPARVRVRDREKGDTGDVESLATSLLLLEKHASPQPDGVTLLPGERWRIRGHRLRDGTIMPCRGTYRTARA
jgi:hypothetical protein